MTDADVGVGVKGTVEPGFESVKNLFDRNMRQLAEDNAQLCVYVGDRQVVDLTYSADPNSTFSADSLVNIFSSGKSLEAIAMASLVSQGLVDYSKPITDYWPEFGGSGKQDLLVADLMRHEAGLAAFNVSIPPADLLTASIKENRIGKIIEAHPQKYRQSGERREYHAVTRGWIVNELFRRIDLRQRTLGEFVREELGTKLGADVLIGLTEQELGRTSPVSPIGFGQHFRESMKPMFMGRGVRDNFFSLTAKIARMAPMMRGGTTRGTPPPFEGMASIEFFNDPAIVMGETPSANTHASARGLAKIAAAMASGGRFGDHTIVSPEGWEALHAHPVPSSMGLNTTFTQGGIALFAPVSPGSNRVDRALNQGREGFFGWMGLGGSVFQWNPEHKIGFSFVPTKLHVLDFVNERAKAYQAEILRLVR